MSQQWDRLQRSSASVTLLEDLLDPGVGKREEAGLVEQLTNVRVCFGLRTCYVLSSSRIALLMDAVQKEPCAFLLSEA